MSSWVRLSSDEFVGRETELDVTLHALQDLGDGRTVVVAVGGPAGIGKTRFVTTVAERLRSDGVRVMVGSCLDVESGGPAYAALISAFRSVDPPAVQVLDALSGAIDMRRSALFELLRSTTEALARRRPTVLVIEDLHWADRITRDALRYLTAMIREGRLALVVTYRDDDVAAQPQVAEFLDTLQPRPAIRVSLGPLSENEVAAQLAGISGAPPELDAARRLHRRTGGIPLLVEEVVAAEAAGMSGVPDHLRHLFAARVAALGRSVADVVDVLAVAGTTCDEQVIAEVLSLDREHGSGALDRAVAANVVVADDRGFRLRHALLREALYGNLPRERRKRLHARLAEAIAASARPDVAALAHHWYAAGDPAKAVPANLVAADQAERVHAVSEVHAHLERALELLPTGSGTRATMLARAAETAWLSGSFQRAVELAEDCLGAGDGPPPAVRWERLARYRWVCGDGAGAQAAHEQSVQLLGDDSPATVRARVLSGYAWYLAMAGRSDDARARSEEAVAAADESGEPRERCRALLAWGYARVDAAGGLDALWRARELAIACDSGDELGRVHAALALAFHRNGDTVGREEALLDGLAYISAHGLEASYVAVLQYLYAELLLDTGRWDEADGVLGELRRQRVLGLPELFADAYRASLAARRGDFSTAAELAAHVVESSGDRPQQQIPLIVALCARAESRLWAGDLPEAAELVGDATVPDEPVVDAQVAALRARAHADLSEQARRRGVHIEPFPLPTWPTEGNPRVRAFEATIRAERSRGSGSRDPRPWTDAVAAWEEAGDPYQEAYCRWRLASVLVADRSGRRAARQELEAAWRATDALSAVPLRSAIEQLAATSRLRLGGRLPEAVGPAAVAAQLRLTPRELEIVPLLAAGRTNAEIAAALVISPRTVGVHVSRILAKLGASRRTEAADVARRVGLVRD